MKKMRGTSVLLARVVEGETLVSDLSAEIVAPGNNRSTVGKSTFELLEAFH